MKPKLSVPGSGGGCCCDSGRRGSLWRETRHHRPTPAARHVRPAPSQVAPRALLRRPGVPEAAPGSVQHPLVRTNTWRAALTDARGPVTGLLGSAGAAREGVATFPSLPACLPGGAGRGAGGGRPGVAGPQERLPAARASPRAQNPAPPAAAPGPAWGLRSAAHAGHAPRRRAGAGPGA